MECCRQLRRRHRRQQEDGGVAKHLVGLMKQQATTRIFEYYVFHSIQYYSLTLFESVMGGRPSKAGESAAAKQPEPPQIDWTKVQEHTKNDQTFTTGPILGGPSRLSKQPVVVRLFLI